MIFFPSVWLDNSKPMNNVETISGRCNLTIYSLTATTAKSLQLCPTLCNPIDGSPIDGSPPGSPIPGILQARTLEWIAISFSNAWKWKVKVKSLSRVRLLATPWTAAYQAPPSMGFSRQEYWSGCRLDVLLFLFETLDWGEIFSSIESCLFIAK